MTNPASFFSRRDFLAAGSLALLTTSVPMGNRVEAGGLVRETLLSTPLPLAPVGFFPVEEAGHSPRERALSRIANALYFQGGILGTGVSGGLPDPLLDPLSLPEGDPRFVEEGVSLTVWGWVPQDWPNPPSAIDVEVLFEPFHSQRFQAWSYRTHPARMSPSPCRLNVPIDATVGLNLEASVRWEEDSSHPSGRPTISEHRGSLRLAVGRDPGIGKLLPGVHLISLLPATARRPSSPTLRMGSVPCLLLETRIGANPSGRSPQPIQLTEYSSSASSRNPLI